MKNDMAQLNLCPLATAVFAVVVLVACILALPGCAVNGVPMRFNPSTSAGPAAKSLSWYIEGNTKTGETISCSFVEFDERGDFIDFDQHRDCEKRIKNMVASGPVLLVMYCHGWKNNSQSEDVIKFNSFLAKLAASREVSANHFRVHGIYLSWRGNVVRPYIDQSDEDGFYKDCLTNFHEPIVAAKYGRGSDWIGFIPENVDFFNRERAAEHRVSALPMARAIFTYASAAKAYGAKLNNKVMVMGHSMGALLLERSLGQAMTGSIVMEWWHGASQQEAQNKPALPFDFILFLNSAAPSIYAKEMRDFLEADRKAQGREAGGSAPVIISLTSTADSATGGIFPAANFLAPLDPSLARRYTNGIFGTNGQTHAGIRQSEFYTKTPGHQPYLVNHWIVPEKEIAPASDAGTDAVFADNLSQDGKQDPYVFLTSKGKHPAAAWRITTHPPCHPVTLNGLPLSMPDSDYWIMNCGEELIAGHGDIWSTTTMEMYAGLYRLAAHLKNEKK